MFTAWADLDRTFSTLDELRRRIERTFEDESYGAGLSPSWPRAAIYDTGNELVLKAELPGLTHQNLNLSIHEGVLTLSGERPAQEMEGYAAHRRERHALKFSRSFSLPTRVDAEKTAAMLKDGVLTVTLPKHPESKPRQIAVRAN
jgi:HSP20 family protein